MKLPENDLGTLMSNVISITYNKLGKLSDGSWKAELKEDEIETILSKVFPITGTEMNKTEQGHDPFGAEMNTGTKTFSFYNAVIFLNIYSD